MFFAFLVVVLAADPGSSEDLFSRGRNELKAGHASEALKLFQDSYALQPALGTLLNIADCVERLNRLEQSWQYFSEARAWAEKNKRFNPQIGSGGRGGRLPTALIPLPPREA